MTPAYKLDWPSLEDGLSGFSEVRRAWPERFSETGTHVRWIRREGKSALAICRNGPDILVTYARIADAYRALGVLLSLTTLDETTAIAETSPFERLGVMLDVSRNAVLRPAAARQCFVRFALMGINTVYLYMEDVYQIDEEPFFGYARGAYTPEELRELDDYASMLGLELIPCIQTLGHLEQLSQWPAYKELMDVPGVLLVGDGKANALIRKMLEALSRCFRSRRIHLGMDEAHGLGLGRHVRLKGYSDRFELFNQHLKTVTGMCEELGLHPIIWSDMYFRIGSAEDDYYDRNSTMPDGLSSTIPPALNLVYWDYYHDDSAFYKEWIERHQQLGKKPLFATGAWNWGRLWSCYALAFKTIGAGMTAARTKHLPEALITLWGDDGAECIPTSSFPCVQYFAECAYGHAPDDAHLEARLRGCCGMRLKPLMAAGRLDEVPGLAHGNTSKWLLWHDPLISFMGKSISVEMIEYYKRLASDLAILNGKTGERDLAFAAQLAEVLSLKCSLHLDIRTAYLNRNQDTMRSLMGELRKAKTGIGKLAALHRDIWHEWYKPFGWEVLDRRYGGIVARLQSLEYLLEEWLNHPEIPVEELEYPLQTVDPGLYVSFARAAFPTVWR